MFCSFYLILYIIWFQFSLFTIHFITLIIMSTSILHLFFFTCFLLLKMHYLHHILECPIGPSLKEVQLRRLFDWTNMAAALPQFLGAARHPCFEVSACSQRCTEIWVSEFVEQAGRFFFPLPGADLAMVQVVSCTTWIFKIKCEQYEQFFKKHCNSLEWKRIPQIPQNSDYFHNLYSL